MATLSLKAFLTAAKLKAARDGGTPTQVLEAIILGRFESSVVNGRTVIRTSEAGGSTDFVLPAGLEPAELLELAVRALEWVQAQPEPDNPALPGRIRHYRVCFDKATI